MADRRLDYKPVSKQMHPEGEEFTFPAPTRPRIPTSSPLRTVKLIPSRVGSMFFLDHEKSASLIDSTCKNWHHWIFSSSFNQAAYLVSEVQIWFLDQFTGIWLEFIGRKERRKALYGNDSLDDV
jgi:hypothetical protein